MSVWKMKKLMEAKLTFNPILNSIISQSDIFLIFVFNGKKPTSFKQMEHCSGSCILVSIFSIFFFNNIVKEEDNNKTNRIKYKH